MKKFICFAILLLALVGCLTACKFMENLSDSIKDTVESTPKVEKMLAALSEDNDDDAKALLHPKVAETSDAAISQMSDYLAGRKATSMELTDVSVNTSVDTDGKARQETLTYKVTLDDSQIIYVNVVYLSDNQGDGFTSFQLMLGFTL